MKKVIIIAGITILVGASIYFFAPAIISSPIFSPITNVVKNFVINNIFHYFGAGSEEPQKTETTSEPESTGGKPIISEETPAEGTPTPNTNIEQSTKSAAETWVGTITGKRPECADGEFTDNFTITVTFPQSLVNALQTNDHIDLTNGVFKGTEVVDHQPSNVYCKLGGSTAENVPLNGWAEGGVVKLFNIDASKPLVDSARSESTRSTISLIMLVPTSMSDVKISGSWKTSNPDPNSGTFTLIKQ